MASDPAAERTQATEQPETCSECKEPWDEDGGYMAEDGWTFCASCIEQASYDLGYSWWITVGVLSV